MAKEKWYFYGVGELLMNEWLDYLRQHRLGAQNNQESYFVGASTHIASLMEMKPANFVFKRGIQH